LLLDLRPVALSFAVDALAKGAGEDCCRGAGTLLGLFGRGAAFGLVALSGLSARAPLS
jgi:hypothetical protein